MDAATLRADFPEFADASRYPDATVTFWLGIGAKLLNEARWADLLDHGLELFTAHHLVMAAQNAASAAVAAITPNPAMAPVPGLSTGPVSGKGIDKVSVSYDTSAGIVEGAGHWNLTTYGTQFIALARMVGMGGAQL